ncbi:hypothetical protein BX616_007983 [Lobosporangium transversale]|nr:hypothetical protein BX616_007983 [Lobosporangium transversale]
MASAALSFPIAFWTGVEPIATVSVSLACAQYVVTGLEDGLIWVFTICQFENTLTIKASRRADELRIFYYKYLTGVRILDIKDKDANGVRQTGLE